MSKTFVFALCLAFSGAALAAVPARQIYRQAVNPHLPEIKTCYTARLKQMPQAEGRITVEWDVDDKGQVIKAVVNSAKSTLKDEVINQCLIAKFKTWTFPPAPKGKTAYLSFPFEFANKPAAHGRRKK